MGAKIDMKVIVPKELVNARALSRVVEAALDGVAAQALVDFQTTVATWDSKPKFDIERVPGARVVGTDDENYGRVNEGTPAHRVQPRRAGGVLAFKPKYQAKSRVRHIGSQAGGPSGDTIFSRGHWVSGIEAREFDAAIEGKYIGILPAVMQRAVDSL